MSPLPERRRPRKPLGKKAVAPPPAPVEPEPEHHPVEAVKEVAKKATTAVKKAVKKS